MKTAVSLLAAVSFAVAQVKFKPLTAWGNASIETPDAQLAPRQLFERQYCQDGYGRCGRLPYKSIVEVTQRIDSLSRGKWTLLSNQFPVLWRPVHEPSQHLLLWTYLWSRQWLLRYLRLLPT